MKLRQDCATNYPKETNKYAEKILAYERNALQHTGLLPID